MSVYLFWAIHSNEIGFLAAYKFYVAIKAEIKHKWSDFKFFLLLFAKCCAKICNIRSNGTQRHSAGANLSMRILNGAINITNYTQRILLAGKKPSKWELVNSVFVCNTIPKMSISCGFRCFQSPRKKSSQTFI